MYLKDGVGLAGRRLDAAALSKLHAHLTGVAGAEEVEELQAQPVAPRQVPEAPSILRPAPGKGQPIHAPSKYPPSFICGAKERVPLEDGPPAAVRLHVAEGGDGDGGGVDDEGDGVDPGDRLVPQVPPLVAREAGVRGKRCGRRRGS